MQFAAGWVRRVCLKVIAPLGVLLALQAPAHAAMASGSGFFVTADGYIATNHHVIEGATAISVTDHQGKHYTARVVHTDLANDLALLKIEGTHVPLPIAHSNSARLGDAVFTLGFPNVLMQGTAVKFTEGTISSLEGMQDQPNAFQISVPVQPGNSGGPLINNEGQVVGVVVAKLNAAVSLRLGSGLPEAVNYAVKSNYLLELIASEQNAESKLASPGKHAKGSALPDLVARSEQSAVFILCTIPDNMVEGGSQPNAALTGTLKKIKESGVVNLGYHSGEPPYSYVTDKQQPIGYYIDLCAGVVDAIKRATGPQIRVNFVPVTTQNHYSLLADGAIDLDCAPSLNEQAKHGHIAFSVNVSTREIRAGVKAGSGLRSWQDLAGKRIGIVNAFNTQQIKNRLPSSVTYSYLHSMIESITMLTQDKIDAIVLPEIYLAEGRTQLDEAHKYDIVGDAMLVEPFAMAMRPDDAPFKQLVDQALQESFKNGYARRAYEKWLVLPIPPRGLTIAMPMSRALNELFLHPNDNGV
ncbi:MAG: trypsin-like peptidase domain-containing protein [Burkholderiales bacterium]|nr:trypsin-like peptidase domain-containing protein [Burkholderiales bacterium]